jgi:hypothetical protein
MLAEGGKDFVDVGEQTSDIYHIFASIFVTKIGANASKKLDETIITGHISGSVY